MDVLFNSQTQFTDLEEYQQKLYADYLQAIEDNL